MRKQGFTLIELMIVVTIVGILSGIAALNFFTAAADYRLQAAARDLSSLMRKARSTAIKQRRPVMIGFVLNSTGANSDGSYIFDADASNKKIKPKCGSISSAYTGVRFGFGKAKKSAAVSAEDLPSCPVTFQKEQLSFNSQGVSNAGYVYLANEKGSAIAIGVSSTGAIMYKQWNGSKWQ